MRKFGLLLLICLLSSCRSATTPNPPGLASPTPPVAKGISASAAKLAFDSSAEMTKMLEERWPLAAIVEFCIPERRHDNKCQNLVAFGEVWKGDLYAKEATGFDQIAWYATTRNGRAEKFSLGVSRGKDFWLLEGGPEQAVQQAPNFSPDPKTMCFVGHK